MSKKYFSVGLFLFAFLTVYLVSNYYIYFNLVHGFALNGLARIVLAGSFFVLSTIYIASWFLRARASVSALSYLGSAWMGVLAISFSVFLIKDILSFLLPFSFNWFLISFGLILLLIGLAIAKVLFGPQVKEINLRHQKIKNSSLKIIHLSDLHLGVLTSADWLKKIVKKINELNVDLIVITGDLTDDSFAKIERFVPIMQGLKAKEGVYAIAGNHEYYTGINNFKQFCNACGINVLWNEGINIAGINLIGFADELSHNPKLYRQNLEHIFQEKDPGLYNILLIHQPIFFKMAVDLGIDLQLSGHTHQGQLPPMNILVRLAYQYAYGLHSWKGSHIYTTSGTGTWGPPMRLFSNSEIVFFTISP